MLKTAMFSALLVMAVASGWATPARSESAPTMRHHRVNPMAVFRKRPQRLEGPLRATNVTDAEVREIEAVVRGVVPGAIVNIGGVTVGCPCEDGPDCTEQVWVVDERAQSSVGLMLSRISGHWQLGPVQSWFLDYQAFMDAWRIPVGLAPEQREERRKVLVARRLDLFESFPACVEAPAMPMTADRTDM